PCNDSKLTMMDASVLLANGRYQSCDPLAGYLAQQDSDTLARYWRQGQLYNLQALHGTPSMNGDTALFQWEDDAWAESHHRVFFYQWNGSQDVYFGTYPTITDVGVTRWSYLRYMQVQVDPRSFGLGAGYYKFCGWAWHRQGQTAGPFNCSGYVYIN